MTPFARLTAPAIPLPLANVDTDQLIPARFMKRARSEGYGDALLHDLRRGDAASLDDPARAGAAILVARRNFGSGSSREAAVYALWDYGIRAVLAPSIGDIFASNAAANGLLAATVSDADAEALMAYLAAPGALTVDLEACAVTAGMQVFPFAIEPVRRLKLLNGWDDFDMTAARGAEVAAWASRDAVLRPWALPVVQRG